MQQAYNIREKENQISLLAQDVTAFSKNFFSNCSIGISKRFIFSALLDLLFIFQSFLFFICNN